MARRSFMLDRGSEPITIYPEKVTEDRRGNRVVSPDLDNPVERRIHVSTDRQSDAELAGQVSVKILKGICRDLPLGSYIRADFRGEQWELAAPETRSRFTRATRHVEVILRSRNMAINSEVTP